MRLTWSLPEGVEPGPIQWPAPHMIRTGDLVSYGYVGRALLLQELTLPEKLPRGPVTLKARSETLVCAGSRARRGCGRVRFVRRPRRNYFMKAAE